MKKKKAVKVILWILAAIFVIAAIGVGGLYYYWKFEVIPRLMPSASPGVAGEVIPETALPENAGEVLIEQVEAIIQENDMQDYLNQESPKEAGRLLNLLEVAKKKKEAQRQERKEQWPRTRPAGWPRRPLPRPRKYGPSELPYIS